MSAFKNIVYPYSDPEPFDKKEALSFLRQAAEVMNVQTPSEFELEQHAQSLIEITSEDPNAGIKLRKSQKMNRVFDMEIS